MTRSPEPRAHDIRAHDIRIDDTRTLRHVEALLLGVLFLGVVAMASLPAARGSDAAVGWMPLWLLGLPAAGLATARLLAWSRRGAAPAAPAATVARRRRCAMAVSRRRPAAGRRTARLLAAIVLR